MAESLCRLRHRLGSWRRAGGCGLLLGLRGLLRVGLLLLSLLLELLLVLLVGKFLLVLLLVALRLQLVNLVDLLIDRRVLGLEHLQGLIAAQLQIGYC